MLPRSVLLFCSVFVLALASASSAEARRLRLFMGVSRATSAPTPTSPSPARTGGAIGATPSTGAPPVSGSGGAAAGLPMVAPLAAVSEEQRARDEAAAKAALASQPPLPEQRRGSAIGFETVSAEGPSKEGFETLSLR